jgi:hypothetical protein
MMEYTKLSTTALIPKTWAVKGKIFANVLTENPVIQEQPSPIYSIRLKIDNFAAAVTRIKV